MTAKRKLVFVQDMPSYQHSRKSSRKSSRSSSKTLTTDSRQTWPRQSQKSYLKYYDPFPAVAHATMRYSTVISLNAGIATPANYLFRANSLFDPDYSGIGHQPYGFDTYATIYDYYEVIDCIITMTPISGSTSGIYGITLEDDNNVEINYDTIREQKGAKIATFIDNGTNSGPLVHKYTAKFFPNKYQQSSSMTTNAANPFFFNCFMEGRNDTAEPSSVDFMITLTFRARFNELKSLGQS